MSVRAHWERIYTERRPDDVSWYQREPALSLEMIRAAGLAPDARILDVGAGASLLVDRLLAAGFAKVGVLDISAAALREGRTRLGDAAEQVEWIVADLLNFEPDHPWELWHDRAVFHFLVDAEDRARYREALYRSVPVGGHLVISTFGPEGPERCSGLDARRYSAEGLAEALGDGVALVESRVEDHTTPSGGSQQFVYARLRRVDGEA
jgi:SAM-dependent methyltransferase